MRIVYPDKKRLIVAYEKDDREMTNMMRIISS